MFAELIFASLLAGAGGSDAQAAEPAPRHAIVREAQTGSETSRARFQLAADLGCPRHYRRGYEYPPHCRRRNADPYHDRSGRGYDRYDDRYHDQGPGRYSGYDRDDNRRYSADPEFRGDRLTDRYGRAYPEAGPRDAVPYGRAYRSGAYEGSAPDYIPRDQLDESRRRYLDDERGFEGFPDRGEPGYRGASGPYYQPSSYHGPVRKKKGTTTMTSPQAAVSDAGLTV